MKKKVVSALLCATMVATMFAGCGSKESSDNATTPDTSKADTSSEVTAPARRYRKGFKHLLLERGVQEPYHSSLSGLSGS